MPELLLFITTSGIPGADDDKKSHWVPPSWDSLRCPQVLLVTVWPQADLSEEKKGVPGEFVTTEEPTGAGPFTPLPDEAAPWDALGHLWGQNTLGSKTSSQASHNLNNIQLYSWTEPGGYYSLMVTPPTAFKHSQDFAAAPSEQQITTLQTTPLSRALTDHTLQGMCQAQCTSQTHKP